MPHESDRLIEQRILRRGIIALLAAPLEGAAHDEFLASAEEKMKRQLPAPGRQQMRNYLSVVKD